MVIGMIKIKRQICKELDELEASNLKKQTDVSSECEDSIEFADRIKTIHVLNEDEQILINDLFGY